MAVDPIGYSVGLYGNHFPITESRKLKTADVTPIKFDSQHGGWGAMDGGGSTLKYFHAHMPDFFKFIVTHRPDHPKCKARQRAEEFGLPLVDLDVFAFERGEKVEPGDYFKALYFNGEGMEGERSKNEVIKVRRDYGHALDEKISDVKKDLGIPLDVELPAFSGGGEVFYPSHFTAKHFIANNHPGNLAKYSIEQISRSFFKRGERPIVGMGWRPSAIALLMGETELYTSIHQMIDEMDAGPVFMRGYPLMINQNRLQSMVNIHDMAKLKEVSEDGCQNALKELGDWPICVALFMDLLDGNWGKQEDGALAYRVDNQWYAAPIGITMWDHVLNHPNSSSRRDVGFFREKHKELWDVIQKVAG